MDTGLILIPAYGLCNDVIGTGIAGGIGSAAAPAGARNISATNTRAATIVTCALNVRLHPAELSRGEARARDREEGKHEKREREEEERLRGVGAGGREGRRDVRERMEDACVDGGGSRNGGKGRGLAGLGGEGRERERCNALSQGGWLLVKGSTSEGETDESGRSETEAGRERERERGGGREAREGEKDAGAVQARPSSRRVEYGSLCQTTELGRCSRLFT